MFFLFQYPNARKIFSSNYDFIILLRSAESSILDIRNCFDCLFFEYGIRNSIWLVPFIIIQSWIWYWFIIESFDISVIWGYFTRIESYITILILLGLNVFAAILGSIAREKYNVFMTRVKKIEV